MFLLRDPDAAVTIGQTFRCEPVDANLATTAGRGACTRCSCPLLNPRQGSMTMCECGHDARAHR